MCSLAVFVVKFKISTRKRCHARIYVVRIVNMVGDNGITRSMKSDWEQNSGIVIGFACDDNSPLLSFAYCKPCVWWWPIISKPCTAVVLHIRNRVCAGILFGCDYTVHGRNGYWKRCCANSPLLRCLAPSSERQSYIHWRHETTSQISFRQQNSPWCWALLTRCWLMQGWCLT